MFNAYLEFLKGLRASVFGYSHCNDNAHPGALRKVLSYTLGVNYLADKPHMSTSSIFGTALGT